MLRKCFTLTLVGLVLLAAGGVYAVNRVYVMFLRSPDAGAEARAFVVEEGEAFASVATRLEAEGLVESDFWMKVTAKMTGEAQDIKAGTFSLTPGMSYAGVLSALTEVAAREEVTLTIPEGFSLAQMASRVTAAFPHISATEWARVTGADSPLESHQFVVAAKKPDNLNLEGYLFPDTYRFFPDATAEQVVTRMIDTMQQHVGEAGIAPTDQLPTIHAALTLASLVEKEVRQPETMRNVADIFLKRLKIGMLLQSDATINFIIGGDDPSPTYADLEVESPYNTYKYPGLMPGPIAAPGLNALNAVADPAENAYYFFLTTDAGEIHYAETYEQHNVNKYQYLK